MKIAAFLLSAITPIALVAQTATPTDILTGRVTDLGDRPVAEAQVEVFSLGSNRLLTKATDSAGRYRIAFPEHAPRYRLTVRKIGFSPAQRTITRGTTVDEIFIADMQFSGAPVALSMVEVTGSSDRPFARERDEPAQAETVVPNPVQGILALKDSLHLSAVQIVGLTYLADSLHAKNMAIFRGINTLMARRKENGEASDMTGTISIMLQEAATNSDRSVLAAEKLLRPEQWILVPSGIKVRLENPASPAR